MTFDLAHITDLHIGPMTFFGPRHWNTKRLLGLLNWYRGRRRAHQMPVLSALVEDMLQQRPDHIAVTGDLVNIGLPSEHKRALDWLAGLGSPATVSVVPGNHDIYTKLPGDAGAMRWRAYMTDNDKGAAWGTNGAAPFPYVQCFGDIALIGLNSAVPTRPFVAAGQLGETQLQDLADCLTRLGDAGLTRVVLIHHPPLPGQAAKLRALRDCEALSAVLGEHGAELVLHGHNHRNMLARHALRGSSAADGAGGGGGEGTSIPVVGAPSASMAHHHKGEPLARYNIYRIATRAAPGARAGIEMIGRGFATPGGKIVELERRKLIPGVLKQSAETE